MEWFTKMKGKFKRHGVWFHIDAAWGGHCLVSENHKHLMSGASRVFILPPISPYFLPSVSNPSFSGKLSDLDCHQMFWTSTTMRFSSCFKERDFESLQCDVRRLLVPRSRREGLRSR